MIDSGSNVYLLSPEYVQKNQVPKVQRDDPKPIRGFDDKAVEGAGRAFTIPLTVRVNAPEGPLQSKIASGSSTVARGTHSLDHGAGARGEQAIKSQPDKATSKGRKRLRGSERNVSRDTNPIVSCEETSRE